MSGSIIFAVVFVAVVLAAAGIGTWIALKAHRQKRRHTREVWQTFADEHDLAFVEADVPDATERHGGYDLFEMEGEYDGEPVQFSARWRHRRNDDLSMVTVAETTLDRVPLDIVVFENAAGPVHRWGDTGEELFLEKPPFDGDLAARASDVASASDFLSHPDIRQALADAHREDSELLLEGGQLRLEQHGFLDDPDTLRQHADLLAATRRAIRRADDQPDTREQAEEPTETDDAEPDHADDSHVAEW
jgi:hypothetical protein